MGKSSKLRRTKSGKTKKNKHPENGPEITLWNQKFPTKYAYKVKIVKGLEVPEPKIDDVVIQINLNKHPYLSLRKKGFLHVKLTDHAGTWKSDKKFVITHPTEVVFSESPISGQGSWIINGGEGGEKENTNLYRRDKIVMYQSKRNPMFEQPAVWHLLDDPDVDEFWKLEDEKEYMPFEHWTGGFRNTYQGHLETTLGEVAVICFNFKTKCVWTGGTVDGGYHTIYKKKDGSYGIRHG